MPQTILALPHAPPSCQRIDTASSQLRCVSHHAAGSCTAAKVVPPACRMTVANMRQTHPAAAMEKVPLVICGTWQRLRRCSSDCYVHTAHRYTGQRPWGGMRPVQVLMDKGMGGTALKWPVGTPEPYRCLAQVGLLCYLVWPGV